MIATIEYTADAPSESASTIAISIRSLRGAVGMHPILARVRRAQETCVAGCASAHTLLARLRLGNGSPVKFVRHQPRISLDSTYQRPLLDHESCSRALISQEEH
ncbi:hypothetical protein GCM10025870_29930 [Agromyces marinus]|uniref:Uncharacterized protein n=1 Tax=Agromyces marinus TaxID=1389020 RepID=A0ABM8H5A9_9MICO|nr:hypothetical protein GCM10025870_29930 [Agromyces marinus]